jgi:hypothetical protein
MTATKPNAAITISALVDYFHEVRAASQPVVVDRLCELGVAVDASEVVPLPDSGSRERPSPAPRPARDARVLPDRVPSDRGTPPSDPAAGISFAELLTTNHCSHARI